MTRNQSKMELRKQLAARLPAARLPAQNRRIRPTTSQSPTMVTSSLQVLELEKYEKIIFVAVDEEMIIAEKIKETPKPQFFPPKEEQKQVKQEPVQTDSATP